MSAPRHIHAVLRADAAVAGLVGNRLFYDSADQASELPNIVLSGGAERDGVSHAGQNGLPTGTVTLICRAKTHRAAAELGEACIDALGGYQGQGHPGTQITVFRSNVDGSDYVPANQTHRRIIGFEVTYCRTAT